jgi:hypothetical protein
MKEGREKEGRRLREIRKEHDGCTNTQTHILTN